MVQEIYISYYYNYLHSHINQRYHYMRHLQFIRHQLIHMFTMGQTDILMKHQAVNNSQNTIDTIDRQYDNPTEIFSLNYKFSYQKKKNKSNTHGTDITGKTLRLLTEVEEAEDQDGAEKRID